MQTKSITFYHTYFYIVCKLIRLLYSGNCSKYPTRCWFQATIQLLVKMSPVKAIEKALKLYQRGEHIWLWALPVCVCVRVCVKAFSPQKANSNMQNIYILAHACTYNTRVFSTWSSPKSRKSVHTWDSKHIEPRGGQQQHCFNKYKVMDTHTHTQTRAGWG